MRMGPQRPLEDGAVGGEPAETFPVSAQRPGDVAEVHGERQAAKMNDVVQTDVDTEPQEWGA